MHPSVSTSLAAALCLLSTISNALPASAPGAVSSYQSIEAAGKFRRDVQDTHDNLVKSVPAGTPSSKPDATSVLKEIFKSRPTGYTQTGLNLTANGFTIKDLEGATIKSSPAPAGNINSFINNNPEPRTPIYPRRNQNDPSYTLPESQLRSALYIPPSSNSTGAPILFVPGTGSFGGINFSPNLLKLISLDPSLGQPYVLNIPRAMLDNIQNNVEYIAYAINYISSLTGSAQISVIGWSQGNLATQWVLKYWPSARSQTKQLISFSPDFHGTAVVNLVDLPGPGPLALPPAILQQRRDSDFIKTLRQGGGDSAYVPTTTIYSALFDEIVQPQAGIIASAYLRDSRGVGVSNNEIQSVCGPTPAGAFGTHESVLFNGLGVALALDALKTGGPADPGRLNLGKVCQDAIYPGLDLEDVLVTEGLIPLAGANILEDLDQGLLVEPEIRAYAK